MTRYRCYYESTEDNLPKDGALITLSKEESYHLLSVLRIKTGETVSVFDGKGNEWICEFGSNQNKLAQLMVKHYSQTPKPKREIILIQATPKGKVMDQIIRQATEIGVSKIFPIETERTELRLDEARAAKRLERWRHITIEASKQSNNSFLPYVSPSLKINDVLASLQDCSLKLVASLQEDSQFAKEHMNIGDSSQIACCIGPEGDFSPKEYQLLKDAGFLPLKLTLNILRSETAALYALSILDGYKK